MPKNNINVRLDSTGTQLDVEDNGKQNEVDKNPHPTTIMWILTGDLAEGKFAGMKGNDRGFQWEQEPPAGIFETPEVKDNGKHLTMVDNHSATNNSGGTWVYKLRVVYKDDIYTTTTDLTRLGSGATPKNPVIINKDP